jgi:hypothetical protein
LSLRVSLDVKVLVFVLHGEPEKSKRQKRSIHQNKFKTSG